MSKEQKWPDTLWIVRHGESAGNVAREEAESSGQDVIQIAQRDADVALSERGENQARAVGGWFGRLPAAQRPTVILASPYVRAQETARLLAEAAGLGADVPFLVDERLREKEFGILDRLTFRGIAEKYPEQAEFRQRLGKFYYRPPGGESWCDVILRLRSLTDALRRDWRGRERVLVVSHQVVVLCFRYLLEGLNEAELLAIDHAEQIANCAVSSYEFDPARGERGGMTLRLFNHVAPVAQSGEDVTREPDSPVGAT